VAAWLCRRYSEATLSELAGRLGQSRADSVPSLVRRMEARLRTSSQLVEDVKAIVALLSTAPDRPGITTQDRPLSGQRTPTRKPRNYRDPVTVDKIGGRAVRYRSALDARRGRARFWAPVPFRAAPANSAAASAQSNSVTWLSRHSRQGRQRHDEREGGREIINRLLVSRDQRAPLALSQSHVEAIVVAAPGS
jgi:hypothetical protein